MSINIKALKESLNIEEGLAKLEGYNRTDYNSQASLIRAFLKEDKYDSMIETTIVKLINSKLEQELHTLIASLSYMLPSYGLDLGNKYEEEAAKLSLATLIVRNLSLQTEERITSHFVNGKKTYSTTQWIKPLDYKEFEKNLVEGIHTKPGVILKKYVRTKPGAKKVKLDKTLKFIARGIASMPMKLVDDLNGKILLEELLKGADYSYALKGDSSEHRLAMKARFTKYAELYDLMKERSNKLPLYLSVFFDYRGRIYYDVPLSLLNPQHKLGKYVWEANTPRKLSELDYKSLAFAIVSASERTSYENIVEKFESKEQFYYDELLKAEGLELVYNKRLIKAVEDYREGNKSRFLIARDFTTGGLLHFSSGYTMERKSLALSNLFNTNEVYDTHSAVAKAVSNIACREIARNDAKVINQSLLAGAGMKSVTDAFNDHLGTEVSIKDMEGALVEVYGNTATTFNKYNRWGRSVLDNFNTSLMWTMPDGVKAQSSSFIKGQEVKLYVPDASAKEGTKSIKVTRNMPLLVDNSSGTPLCVGIHAEAKVSGFLANVTHSIDAYVLRKIVKSLIDAGEVGLFIHDNILTFGINHETLVMPTAQEVIKQNMESKIFLDIQHQVAYNHTNNPPVIDYSKDTQDTKVFEVGTNFLQA